MVKKITELKRLSWKHKNNKILYYLANTFRFSVRYKIRRPKADLELLNDPYVQERIAYYNKLVDSFQIGEEAISLGPYRNPKEYKTYFFDFWDIYILFKKFPSVSYLFGDINYSAKVPSFVKSRPIEGNNVNSIVLNLNKIRHFLFIKNDKPFTQKMDQVAWRGKVRSDQPHRIKLLEKCCSGNPIYNVGMVNNQLKRSEWLKRRMTISEFLDYKFLLSVEGNDVASNLKWIMSSNSLCIMTKPKFETWFMEGKLVGGIHYAEVKPDYSDLDETIEYYIQNPEKAQAIIQNAHTFVEQFKNKKREKAIGFGVMLKYFDKSGQIVEIP